MDLHFPVVCYYWIRIFKSLIFLYIHILETFLFVFKLSMTRNIDTDFRNCLYQLWKSRFYFFPDIYRFSMIVETLMSQHNSYGYDDNNFQASKLILVSDPDDYNQGTYKVQHYLCEWGR